MATRAIKPPAALAPRDDRKDRERLISLDSAGFSYDLLKDLSCFGGSVSDGVRALPGTIVMRFFRRGEVICHQDDPGFTAFYVLTREEIKKLSESGKLPPLASFENWQATAVASVRRMYYGKARKESKPAFMGEGEIFGEMSCLSRIPRTATVKAEHDCYVLEFMGNVFVQAKFEKKLGTKVVERILELHLKGIELFEKLSDAGYSGMVEKIKERLGLSGTSAAAPPAAAKKTKEYEFRQTCAHDEVLFAENDRPDGLYIIRLGMVKVVKNASPLLGKDDIGDWSKFEAALRAGATEADGPRHGLWQKLPAELWQKLDGEQNAAAAPRISGAAAAPTRLSEAQQELLYAVNDLLKLKNFFELIQLKFEPANPLHAVLEKEAKILNDPKQFKDSSKKFNDILRLRTNNRQILEMILGDVVRPFGTSPPQTLGIRSSRDWVFAAEDPASTAAESSLIGEMGLFDNLPRSATCVVYCHPEGGKFGETDLFYIPKDLFVDLLDPDYVKKVIAERKLSQEFRLSQSVWQESANAQRLEELGLVQGQKLMLIDLDRCTRCDKCVEACVASHSPPGVLQSLVENVVPAKVLDWTPFRNTGPRDGRSRLFLDGPRIGRYLVPTTCRQCKEPICLINCPVGSIHKGDNGQIVIENWCIGCNGCAEKCPYNSIQMHPVGVIPRSTFGWRHRQGQGAATVGATPFRDGRDLRALYGCGQPIEFAYTFELSKTHINKSKTFMLYIESSAADLKATINGKSIALSALTVLDKKTGSQVPSFEKNRDIQWNWKTMLALAGEEMPQLIPGEKAEMEPQRMLHVGQNEIVVQCSLPSARADAVLLDVGLTGYIAPVVEKSVAGDDYKQEWVMKTAVVCDMCSGQAGHQPACVNACPHEAAERRYMTYNSLLPLVKQ